MGNDKLVLDATCGSRMIWFDKNNPLALYVDRREIEDETIWKSGDGLGTRHVSIHPDVLADFTSLPFEDNTFYNVVFDPPHLTKLGDNAWLCKKYGKLGNNWRQVIHDGFQECMRVLKPGGTLVFKWCEYEIPTKDVIAACGKEPLYGNRSGKAAKTHWMIFIKTPTESDQFTVDAVPVVRCKECRYDGACMTQSISMESESVIPFDRSTFYCADGERRTDGRT